MSLGASTVSRPSSWERTRPGSVHVALDVVAAERLARLDRGLEVHLLAERLGAGLCLAHDVEGEASVLRGDNRQAGAVDGDRVSNVRLQRGLHDEPPVFEGHDAAALANDSREHVLRLLLPLGLVDVGAQEDVLADRAGV